MTRAFRLAFVAILVGTIAACDNPVRSTEDPPPAATAAATSAAASPSPTPSAQPLVEQRTVTETVEIPFAERTVQDSTLTKGTTKVRTQGVVGLKTLTYQVTVTNGVETARKLARESVTRAPVDKVTLIGTKEHQSSCDPNYSGCVPIASDVDCAGGGGDGPAYVSGPIRVIGTDIYGLDRDHDGIACE